MLNLDFINDNQRVLISQFTDEEISNGIKKLKNNKTSGLDFISNEMIKVSQSFYPSSLFSLIKF